MVPVSYATPRDKVPSFPATVHCQRWRGGFRFFYFVTTNFSEEKRKFKYFNDGDYIYDHRHYQPYLYLYQSNLSNYINIICLVWRQFDLVFFFIL